MLYLVSNIQFEEDISKLIPSSEDSKELQKVLKSTNFSDKLIVNIQIDSGGSFEDLSNYASDFIDSISASSSNYIKHIQGSISDEDLLGTMDFVYNNLPLFLEKEDYVTISNKIRSDSIEAITSANYKSILSPSGMITKNMILKDPLGLSFIALKKMQALNIGDQFILENGFIVTRDKKNILLFITPKLESSETDNNSEFVDQLYNVQKKLNTKFKSKVKSDYFGGVIIAVANAKQIKNDIQFTVSISLTILLIILIVFYKKLSIPIVLFVPTIIGGLLAGIVLLIVRDKISAISLGLGSVLLGITLDYSLHILTHLRNNNSIKNLYKDVTQPILMSSFTTAIAFLCLLFIKSQALQDLGIFAAVSVLGASVFALIFIPLIYKVSDDNKSKSTLLDKVAHHKFHRNKLSFTLLGVLLIISLFTYSKVKFNKDLSKLNFMPEEMIYSEEKLDQLTNFSSKSLYVTSFANDLEEVLLINQEIHKKLVDLKQTDKIYNFSSIGSLIFSQKVQKEKIAKWNSFWSEEIYNKTKNNLIFYGEELGFKPKSFQQFYNLLEKEFQPISINDYQEIKTFLVEDYINEKPNFTTITSLLKVKNENIVQVEKLFKGQENMMLIDRKKVNEIFLGSLKNNFNELIFYSLIAVVLILLVFYKSISLTLITSIPIVLTWLLTIGIMGLLGIEFNVFNIIISSFIFGLGIDYSIFMTNALIKDYTYGTKNVSTYKISILLSVITTVLGVGVLVFAKHPALYSISIVSLIGILITVLVAFTIQPLLFNVFIKDRAKRGYSPISIRLFIGSFLLTLFYAVGGVILSLFSITILQILPISKKKKFKWMHQIVSRFSKQVLNNNFTTKKKVVNEVGEDFTKPAIIVANHASSLDTISLNSLTHNVIYMVNDWVYKSPIFGILARSLGYYPVTTGVDGSVSHLSNKLNQGYMLCVFPEGKRSFTNKIGRFHKGAFFLQQQLKIDILPIYLHGNSEVMPKGDFMIYSGALTAKVGERISYNDTRFEGTERERTKKISTYYKNNFNKSKEEIEGVDYYKRILLSNYKYKDPDIIPKVKTDFNIQKNKYFDLNKLMPLKSKIIHLADDFGQIDILLVAKSLDRKITSIINDTNKLSIAKNCYTNSSRKVKYDLNTSSIIAGNFDILLISNTNQLEHIKDSMLLEFKSIILFNNNQLTTNIKALGFKVKYDKDSVVFLTRNRNEE